MKNQAQIELSTLIEVLQAVKKPDDLQALLTDLCTPGEIEAMSGRWLVAKLIRQGASYRDIAEQTGVSTATITRVARCLNEGRGYQKALELTEKKKQRG